MSPTEIYDTAEDRQMHRFDALVGSDLVHHGALVQQAVAVRVVLTERLTHFDDHVTRGRRIFAQGTITHTDGEGAGSTPDPAYGGDGDGRATVVHDLPIEDGGIPF